MAQVELLSLLAPPLPKGKKLQFRDKPSHSLASSECEVRRQYMKEVIKASHSTSQVS